MIEFNNKNIDKLIKPKLNYVYFIINKEESKVYVGETTTYKRIQMYYDIINQDLEPKDIIIDGEVIDNYKCKKRRLYKYCKNQISGNLYKDLLKMNKENSEVIFLKTTNNKYLEKCYINLLYKNKIGLYNKQKFRNHKYDIEHINIEVFNKILDLMDGNTIGDDTDLYYSLFDSSVMKWGNPIYLCEGLYIYPDGSMRHRSEMD